MGGAGDALRGRDGNSQQVVGEETGCRVM